MWAKIVASFQSNPRDVKTCPLRREGRWFYVCVRGGNIFVQNSKSHFPSCQIQGSRRLNPEECDPMYELYCRRQRGERVSQEAIATTVNQVYWYGIFHDIEL